QHAHQKGIIHRDLKPSNVMIRLSDDGMFLPGSVRVLDFGLAAFADPSLRETEGAALLGTPMYMSPEQAEGRRNEVGPASDLFSLGSVLYELLTGRAAFLAEHLPEIGELFRICSPLPPSQLRSDCGPELDAVCRKCLQREPADRYVSMAALAADLRAIRNGDAPQAMTADSRWKTAERRLQKPGQLSRIGIIVMILTVFSCLSIAATITASRKPNAPSAWPGIVVALVLFSFLLSLDWRMVRETIRPWQMTLRYAFALLTAVTGCFEVVTHFTFPSLVPEWQRLQISVFSFLLSWGQLALLTAALYACRFVSLLSARSAVVVLLVLPVTTLLIAVTQRGNDPSHGPAENGRKIALRTQTASPQNQSRRPASSARDVPAAGLVAEPETPTEPLGRKTYLEFDGSGGAVRIPKLRISPQQSFTVECWVHWQLRPGTLSEISRFNCLFAVFDPGRLSNADGSGGELDKFLIRLSTSDHNSNIFLCAIGPGKNRSYSGHDRALPEQWVHLACLVRNSELEFYFNGVPGSQKTMADAAAWFSGLPPGDVSIGSDVHPSG
ncbi:MAG: protein kinase, partial [Planctomycetaceae bacterium]|nr:protein kinase [Planctomycetaceae bacterium]